MELTCPHLPFHSLSFISFQSQSMDTSTQGQSEPQLTGDHACASSTLPMPGRSGHRHTHMFAIENKGVVGAWSGWVGEDGSWNNSSRKSSLERVEREKSPTCICSIIIDINASHFLEGPRLQIKSEAFRTPLGGIGENWRWRRGIWEELHEL